MEKCYMCEENQPIARVSLTSLDGELLDQEVLCRKCLDSIRMIVATPESKLDELETKANAS